jgi:hypothetical protein
LKTGGADEDEDGLIYVNDLYEYAHNRTIKRSSQSPVMKTQMEGKILIAKNLIKIKEKEYELKKSKLLKELSIQLPPRVFDESLTILRTKYHNPSSLEQVDFIIYNFLEYLLKGEFSVDNYIEAVQDLKGISISATFLHNKNTGSVSKPEVQKVGNTRISEDIEKHEIPKTFTLSPIGAISVFSNPNGAGVYLDGIYQGKTPWNLETVTQGSHLISLILAGYDYWSQNINVEAGKITQISQQLDKSATKTAIMAPAPKIKITSPSNSASVNIQEIVTGTEEHIPEGSKLQIYVYACPVSKYYPQNGSMTYQNERWSTSGYIGDINTPVGTEFDIITVLADQKAQKEFDKYFEMCGKYNNWSLGMESIPESAKVYDRIRVTRA